MICKEANIVDCPGCALAKKKWKFLCLLEIYEREIKFHIKNNSLKAAFLFWLELPGNLFTPISFLVKHKFPEQQEVLDKTIILRILK